MSSNDHAQPPRIKSSHQSGTSRRRLLASIITITFGAAAAILFNFDPVRSDFYPQCTFKKLTGWSCPACGCLRASHQLLHGHFAAAFHLNALFIITLPLLVLLALEQFFGKRIIPKTAFLGWTLLAIFIVFGVLRNLPAFAMWSGR